MTVLYTKAKERAQMRDDSFRARFDEFENWLESSVKVSSPWHPNGRLLVHNLRLEAHLVGERAFGEPDELADFMIDCLMAYESDVAEDVRVQAFRDVCRKRARQGLKIPVGFLPDSLIRYCSEAPLKIALQRMVGDYAASQLKLEQMTVIEAEQQVRENWDSDLLTARDRLALGEYAFATYDSGTIPAGSTARYIAECLALPCVIPDGLRRPRFLVKLSYATTKVVNHRFPTVAEAETFPYFQPAPEVPPDPLDKVTCVGWTKAVGSGNSQPELIHDNTSLRVLGAPIELVGSFML